MTYRELIFPLVGCKRQALAFCFEISSAVTLLQLTPLLLMLSVIAPDGAHVNLFAVACLRD